MPVADDKNGGQGKQTIFGGFDKDIALLQLEAAILPIRYEHLLRATGNRDLLAREGLQNFARSQGLDVKLIRSENTTAVLVYHKDKSRITVAFSASDEAKDILDNANLIPVAHDTSGHVHAGFKNAADRVAEEIKKEVVTFSHMTGGRVQVDMAGFSQGGTAALITAADWMKKDGFLSDQPHIHLSSVHTFGSPPAGTRTFVDGVEKMAARNETKLVRIVDEFDPVPAMMTKDGQWWIPPIYTHADNGIILRGNGKSNEKDWNTHDPFAYFEKISALPRMAESKPENSRISNAPLIIHPDGILLADSFIAVAEGASLKPSATDDRILETAIHQQPSPNR